MTVVNHPAGLTSCAGSVACARGLAARWIPYLAVIEGAGVAGLVAGLLGVRPLGLAAATGLVAFFVVAVLVLVRVRAFHNIAFPVVFLALAAAATAHFSGAAT